MILTDFFSILLKTILDIAPIVVIIFGFQFLVIRKPITDAKRVAIGFIYVLLGLSMFLVGLDYALFPIGRLMAEQLTSASFIGPQLDGVHWQDYLWVYIFAFTIGASTAMAEPSLIAVAIKANAVSGGAIGVLGLRIAVALGVAFGIALGTWRIATGYPIQWFIIASYLVVILLTLITPKLIVPLAYDSGGVATSTVTVPIIAALGLGLASAIPGRNPVLDGFGLIAFACLFPIISVMLYAKAAEVRARKQS